MDIIEKMPEFKILKNYYNFNKFYILKKMQNAFNLLDSLFLEEDKEKELDGVFINEINYPYCKTMTFQGVRYVFDYFIMRMSRNPKHKKPFWENKMPNYKYWLAMKRKFPFIDIDNDEILRLINKSFIVVRLGTKTRQCKHAVIFLRPIDKSIRRIEGKFNI